MKKFSDKRGSKEKIKSFEKLFNFICFLDSSDGGDDCGDLLCYGAVFWWLLLSFSSTDFLGRGFVGGGGVIG